jgi:hypothetical protein
MFAAIRWAKKCFCFFLGCRFVKSTSSEDQLVGKEKRKGKSPRRKKQKRGDPL